jgi:TPP-dependent 2-oxoacid decarboxylase
MSATVIEYALARLKAIGISEVFGVAVLGAVTILLTDATNTIGEPSTVTL